MKPSNHAAFAALLLFLSPAASAVSNNHGGHADPIAPVILGVTGIVFFAVLGRYAARHFSQPPVLGEILIGVFAGNLLFFMGVDFILVLREGSSIFDMINIALSGESWDSAATQTLPPETAQRVLNALEGPQGPALFQIAQTVDVFSRYGVIFLLFLVGLDTSIDEMRLTGAESTRVAIVGVVAPFLLGFVVARLFLPNVSLSVDFYIAATLSATSIGISARVLKDIRKEHSREAHVILGAAVIDDVLGLLMLAIVSGVIVTGTVEALSAIKTVILALIFILASFTLGPFFLRLTIWLLQRFDLAEAKLFVSFLFVMVLAWFANLVGLASIIGAFAAGLILHDAYFRYWDHQNPRRVSIKDLVGPLEAILAPIFFVLMGIQVKVELFFDWQVLGLAATLLLAAMVGKLLSGLGAGKHCNRLAVGIGMMPRGEVGLIFASIGKTLGVLNDQLFSAIVLMVIVTTLITPLFLKLALIRNR